MNVKLVHEHDGLALVFDEAFVKKLTFQLKWPLTLATDSLPAPALSSQFVADAFADDLAFELSKREQDV